MRQAERRARTRAALLEAASAYFASRGYENASVEAIAASAGLSKGAMYAHFATKLELFLAVVEQVIDDASRRLRRVADALESGGSIEQAANAYFGWPDDSQHTALIAETWRTASFEQAVGEAVARFLERRNALLGTALVAAGRTPAEALRAAEMLGQLIDGALVQRQLARAVRADKAG
ncbi:helix-turn-helix domain-containing protein [Tepidiforma sp.]|uniref:TetR/AcrR family transcriptional regulator n=1 Tax=Tepidiforma sp. TaxID=2682230 RepID=UPI002ADE2FC2|nr:helix-turn-helix domain-containing protein [Tepidiforma sp.]